jgi:predicted RNA-binding protein YlxR (DUF448 family)
MCVACRTVRPKREFVRIVRTPDRRMAIDATGRLAGRGAYLCADGSCWRTALAKNHLTRALEVPLSDDVRAHLESGATTHDLTNTRGGNRGQE